MDYKLDGFTRITLESKRENPTILTVGILILILLFVSVFFGINQKNKNEFNKESEKKLNLATSLISEQLSRESFVEAKTIAFKLKDDGYKSNKLDDLINIIISKEEEVLGEIKTDAKELLDLTLQTSGFNGEQIVSTGEDVFVFDKQNKNIIQMDINGKGVKKVAGKDVLEGAIQIASYEDRIFSLNNDGIYEITKNKQKINEQAPSFIYLYSGNVYLTDKSTNMIYRLVGNNGVFGEKSDWLAPGIEADFSKVIDMTIDGSIWLLSSSGKVTKFTNGNPQAILLKGIVSDLKNPTAIYSNEELKYVYILDKEKGRVVVLEKNGNFKLQYVADGIKEAKDLIVSEEENKIILLTGPKLMYFEPK